MKKSITTKAITEIAILSAIAYVLDALQGGLWRGVFPNGGSIGFAMLPILIISYRRGFKSGLICGFILSFIQMLSGVYAIANSWYSVMFQIILDYILAYPCVALAGAFFKSFKKETTKNGKIKFLILGTAIGGFMKFMCHFLAGFIFWSSYCPANYFGGPVVYSLLYNGGYMLPNIIINAIVLVLLFMKAPSLFKAPDEEVKIKAQERLNYAKWMPLSVTGLAIFCFSLASFIMSFVFYQDKNDKGELLGNVVEFNEDTVVFMIIGLIVIVYSLVALFKNAKVQKEFNITGALISAILCFYPLGVFFNALFKAISKGKEFIFGDYQNYLFMGVIFLCALVFMIISLVQLYKKEKEDQANHSL